MKKNLRFRDGRWHWHWDPAFLTAPLDDPFVRVEKLEQAAINLTIPILLIRGRLSDVVSEEGVKDFLDKVPHAEFVELSDAGHTAAGDDNDAFSEVVVRVRQPMSQQRRTVGFNFLEEPELPAPQVTEAQAEADRRDALRPAGARQMAGQQPGLQLHRSTTATTRSSAC